MSKSKNQQAKKFKIGDKVGVKNDYIDNLGYRKLDAVVINHIINKVVLAPEWFIDNVIQFSDGTIEPFGNWELNKT